MPVALAPALSGDRSGWWEEPPFDHVLALESNGRPHVIPLAEAHLALHADAA